MSKLGVVRITRDLGAGDESQPVSFSVYNGTSYVLSRFGDTIWDLSPDIPNPNLGRMGKCIDWGLLPPQWVDSVKAIALAYWRHGVPGRVRPKARTVWSLIWNLKPFIEWLSHCGISRFADAKVIHIREFVHDAHRKGVKATSLVSYFAAIEKVYLLRDHVEDALLQHPWPESSARNQAGITERGAPQAATEIIPLEMAAQLCRAAESVLNQAERYLDAQEKCERIDVDYRHYADDPILKRKNAYLKSVGLPSRQGFRKRLLDIPTAAYLLLGLLTGMRNHELASLEVGAYYESELGGETYGWLRGTSMKTGEGRTEWMVPLDIGRKIITILERYSTLFRAKLSDQLVEVEAAMGNVEAGQMPVLVKEHARLRAEQRRLFLTTHMTDSNRIGSPSNETWNGRLAVFAEKHGIDWVPKSHQLRRTFAALAVSTGFGDLRYLREHFKHRSLDMTLLYAINPQQDPELLGEITVAAEHHRCEMIERWLDEDSLLAGGGGKTITEQRGEFLGLTTSQRRKLIDNTAQNTFIRGTGHAWCLAEMMGCGGHGLYDALRCGGCTHGVIDESVADVWRGIGRQQLELRDLSDIGPSGQQKVEINIRIVSDVLSDLGIHLDTLSAYPQDVRRNDGQG